VSVGRLARYAETVWDRIFRVGGMRDIHQAASVVAVQAGCDSPERPWLSGHGAHPGQGLRRRERAVTTARRGLAGELSLTI